MVLVIMGETIAIMNQKGGCGKTTTAVNLATSLAFLGKSVLIVDMDPQGNATTSFGIEKTEVENTIYSVLIGDINVKKATISTFIQNLFIIPSNITLSGAGVELSKQKNYHIVLKEVLKDIVPLFDYILIDLPPSLGVLTVNALIASDSVLIPIQAEYYALEGVADLINTIKLVEDRLKSPTPIKGILLTLFDKRTRLSKEVQTELKIFFNGKENLFKTIIPRNITLAEAPSHGKPCLIYDSSSVGSKAYLNLAKEILVLDSIGE
jgi:chromosome partitioning protein